MITWSAHHMYDVSLRKYICMYMFLVTLTHKIYHTLQTRANPYPYPPKPVPLARGKGLEGKSKGTAEIPQGYPRQSLIAVLDAGVFENDKENEKAWLATAEHVTGVYVTARRVTVQA
jgi:hypothetical protein